MRYFLLFFMTFIVCVNTQAQPPSQNELLGQALDSYGTVAGGWYLNQRCKFLSDDQAKVLEKNVAAITVALAKDVGNPSILYKIQAGAKNATDSEKYAGCSENNSKIVDAVYDRARNWAQQIENIQSQTK